MNVLFSKHSEEKIEKRKIPMELIFKVMENPQQISVHDDITIFQSVIEFDNKEYLLRVFVNTNKDPNVVVTVYFTNKISKYWGET